ncbi:hypothetical protein ACP3P8_25585 [Pseudomonas aeruginosa]
MSRLTLPEVNSFVAVGGLLLAAGPDGLYVADGAPLQSLVVTGLVDFGSPQLKRGAISSPLRGGRATRRPRWASPAPAAR